jgi:hypothetical protein
MDKDQEFSWDLKHGLKIGAVRPLDNVALMMQWIQQKLADIGGLMHSADRLMNQAIQEALGPPGVPGDAVHIVYVSRRIARIRKELLAWSIEFNCAAVKPECDRLLSLISTFSKDAVDKLESIPGSLDAEISKALEARKRGEQYTAKVVLSVSILNNDEITAEFERLSQMLPSLL